MSTSQVEKEQEIWQSIQETLKEHHYPVSPLPRVPPYKIRYYEQESSHPVVQSLKELVMSSVHMETSGDPMITIWTAQ